MVKMVGETMGVVKRNSSRASTGSLSEHADLATASLRYSARYPWLESQPDQPVPMEFFERRCQTSFRRAGIRTFGELAQLSDEAFAAIPNAGLVTIVRFHRVMSTLQSLPVTSVHTNSSSEVQVASATAALQSALSASSNWATAVGITTFGELIDAHRGGMGAPVVVAEELEELLSLRLVDAVPSLEAMLDRLLSEAQDPELFIARECVREAPTLKALAQVRGVTRERVRQKVARDAERVRRCLDSNDYLSVQWAVQRFQDEVGRLASVDSQSVERWRDRSGPRHFEVLRWLAGYLYDGEWLLSSKDAFVRFQAELDRLTGDEWLISVDALEERLYPVSETVSAVRFLVESGRWRDIGEGWLVRWDGPIQAKAERVLRLTCTPMTPEELLSAIGHGSVGSIKNQRGDRLIRVDKHSRLGLPEWGLEEYEGIVQEIRQRIDRGGGIASVGAIIEEFTRDFGVSVSSIEAYLALPMFNVMGDSVRFGDDSEFTPRSPSATPNAVKTSAGWGERQVVSEAAMRGYSFSLNPHIAWANGLRPGIEIVVPVNGSNTHQASVIWRTTGITGKVDVGRVREWLVDHGVAAGTELLICPTPEDVTVFVGHEQIEAARLAFEANAPSLAPDIALLMEQL